MTLLVRFSLGADRIVTGIDDFAAEILDLGLRDQMNSDTYSHLIGKIYDCAVDPDQWVPTLTLLRDEMNLAFVSMNYMDFSPLDPDEPPEMEIFNTEWNQDWLDALAPLVPLIPKFDEMRGAELDVPVSQLSLIDEAEFRQTEFCQKWVEPQGLRDTMNMNVVGRELQIGMFSATTYMERGLFSENDYYTMSSFGPHIRRAMLISDLVEEQRSWIQVYNRLLDKISAAIILVGKDGKVFYHNEAAESLLSNGNSLSMRAGKLVPQSTEHHSAFSNAVERACSENDLDMGNWGNGMALPGLDGEVAVAYVLPLGRSERRRALGQGNAAIFITTNNSARPPSIEVLSALSGLTSAEARIALAIADGNSTETTAQMSGVTMNTLRTQLASIYSKTGKRNQAALGAFVNRLSLPVG